LKVEKADVFPPFPEKEAEIELVEDESDEEEDWQWNFKLDMPGLATAKKYRQYSKKLSSRMRRKLLQMAVEALMKEGRAIASEGGIVTKKTELLPFKPGGEWDLDASLDKMLSNNTHRLPSYRDLIRREIIRTRRSFIVMADKSHSLGPTIDYVALAVSVFSEAVKNEQYAILLFDDQVKTLKSVRDFKEEGDILQEMLNVECFGATNMQLAFEKAREQVEASLPGMEGTCVLISDCIPTVGRDHLKAASLLPKIEVLLLSNEAVVIGESCADELRTLPQVRIREIRQLNDIIDCIKDIVSYGSLDTMYGI
jgi:hypothetical protein